MNNDRQARVLQAIVEDYIATAEPVGSKTLVQRHSLGVSSATIRNDMAVLENEGLIVQPHTSAGRVPTDKGYRAFVDGIERIKSLSVAEKRAIAQILTHPFNVDDLLERTVRLLARLTNQVALVQYPRISRSRVRHIECVSLTTSRVLLVLITESGQVGQQTTQLAREIAESELADLRAFLTQHLTDVPLADIQSTLETLEARPELSDIVASTVPALVDLATSFTQDRLLMAGTANLARTADLSAQIGPLLEAFEEQVVVLKLLQEMAADKQTVSVRIGRENSVDSFSGTGMVASTYGGPDRGSQIAIVGPMHMDYPTTMSAVRAVAKYVSVVLEG